MSVSPRRMAVLIATLFLVLPSALAASENDAGSGGDAGNSRATATSIAFGAHSGYVNSKTDRDWYRAPGASEPSCVRGTLTPLDNPAQAWFGLERGSSASLGGVRAPVGSTASFGMSGAAYSAAVLGISALDDNSGAGTPARPGRYDFSLERVAFAPRSSHDALSGSDASGTIQGAMQVSSGCIQGHLATTVNLLGDNADVYSVAVKANETVTFSLAAALDAPIALSLVDAAGNTLAKAGPDGAASYTTPTDGVLYLSAARTSTASTFPIDYIVGLIVFEMPPPCSPNC